MAVTTAQLQAELGTSINSPTVLMCFETTGTKQNWLVSGGVTYPGRVRAIQTTAADSAADQATTIAAALLA